MPVNVQMERCIATESGVLVFWSPQSEDRGPKARVQIIDVFSLQLAVGYTRDPQGGVLLESQPSLASGRSWSMAKAVQLIRSDARSRRWVALQLDKRAWGLFWAGGGLQHCRSLLEGEPIQDSKSQNPPSPGRASALRIAATTSLAWLVVLVAVVASMLSAQQQREIPKTPLFQRPSASALDL
jgi:hypothetical protein